MDEHGASLSTVEDPTRAVTVKDRYRVDGAGVTTGEAVTYGAENVATQQPVALAVLRGEAATDPEFVAAVRDQAWRLAKLPSQHRALVRVYEAGTTDEGEPFVAREPVDGPSLRQVLEERGPLDVHHGLRLAIQVGEGLEALHQSGIVHGELRPESVMLVKDQSGDETVKLGVEMTAAHRTAVGRRTRDRAISAYLAPEQVAYADTSEAADVHGLGLLIRELLTGQRPDGRGARGGHLPEAVARIVAKALEPAPGRRYSSISLMVNDLWSAESEISKSPARTAAPQPAGGRRKPSAARRATSDVGMAVALVLGLLLVAATAWVARSERFVRNGTPEPTDSVAAAPTPPPSAPLPVTPAPRPEPPTVELPPPAPAAAVAPSGQLRVPADPVPVLDDAKPSVVKPAPPVVATPAKPAPSALAKPAAPASRPAPAARPAAQDSSGDGGDGTAIIDWLLKGGRSD